MLTGPRRRSEDGHVSWVAAERGDLLFDPGERRDLVEQPFVPGRREGLAADVDAAQVAEEPEAVVDGDDDHVAASGEGRAVVHRPRAGAGDERAAVEIDHDRAAGIVDGGGPDVEGQAVLARRGGDGQPELTAFAACMAGGPKVVASRVPVQPSGRLRRREPPLSDRRPGVRDASEDHEAVLGDAAQAAVARAGGRDGGRHRSGTSSGQWAGQSTDHVPSAQLRAAQAEAVGTRGGSAIRFALHRAYAADRGVLSCAFSPRPRRGPAGGSSAGRMAASASRTAPLKGTTRTLVALAADDRRARALAHDDVRPVQAGQARSPRAPVSRQGGVTIAFGHRARALGSTSQAPQGFYRSSGVPLDGCRGLQTVERPRWTAMDARSGDLNFRATSTLTQRDQIGVPQLFPWEMQAIRPIGAKIVVKIVVK